METAFLPLLIIVLGLSVIVILAFMRLRLPAILGFILTGVLAGPHALGIIEGRREVEALSELGVVLLLFSIGIEFSLKDLLESRRTVLLGGSIQVVLTPLPPSISPAPCWASATRNRCSWASSCP